MRSFGRVAAVMLALVASGLEVIAGAWAQENQAGKPKAPTAQEAEFFETNVRPVLFEKCFGCHGDKNHQGDLRLDSRAAILKGGGSGPALVAGDPDGSLLVKAIRYDAALKMPPTGKLKPAEIAALTAWVKMGAPWPSNGPTGKTLPVAGKTDAGLNGASQTPTAVHWAFRPVKKTPPPKVKNLLWCKSLIDRFILAKLEAKGLTPAPPADRRTLIRRVTFDLIGLPPTPEEIDAFFQDKSPNAFEKVVDRLLASPAYGERWGRHWLDVARYADTKGYVFTEDPVYHNGYTYRDWVIRAFNEDLPYDQFIVEQLAADKLPLGDDKRPLAALGFLNIGRRFLNDPVLINDDRIDVTCRGLMGLTVACARCHNHKFDPITARDYYALYGVFASSVEPNPPVPISPKEVSEPYERYNAQVRDAEGRRDTLIQAQVKQLRERVAKTPDQLPAEVKSILQSLRPETLPNPGQLAKLSPQFDADAQKTVAGLQTRLADLKKQPPPTPEFALALQDATTPFDPYVFLRGNPGNRGESVPREFIQCIASEKAQPFKEGSGRLELARAIASKDNPLTARVMINRVWFYHFGAGLVRTPGDFGTRGEPPTHPELLDWLASEFTREPARVDEGTGKQKTGAGSHLDSYACGWSLKKLHKMLLLTSAYQQSSTGTARAFDLDPENRLLSHQNRQRLDLEALRDSLLFVSGQLESKMGGPSVELTTAPFSLRRTVYGFIDRQNLQGLYRTFDFASPDTSSAQRFRTTVPQQALYMMNSPFVVERARGFLKRPEMAASQDDAQRIKVAYRLLFGRLPTPDETTLSLRFLRGVGQVRPAQAGASALAPWEEYIQALLMTNEFSFVD